MYNFYFTRKEGKTIGRPAKYIYNISNIVDDYKCINITKNKNNTTCYVMQCQKCGKTEEMLEAIIFDHRGTKHKSCGKGLGLAFDEDFYNRWQGMRQRTTEKSIHSEQYYNRGINSDAFASFIDFFNTMYPSWKKHVTRFGVHDTSLDRIDVDKSYSPENCRWVCLDEQKGNMQKTIYFTVEDLKTGEIEYCKNANNYAFLNHLPQKYIGEVINNNRIYKNKKYTRITKEEYAEYHLNNKTFIKNKKV